MSKTRVKPKNPFIALYATIQDIMPSWMSKRFRGFFFNISPDVPYDLGSRIKDRNYSKPIFYGALIGFLLCFVLTVGFSWYENTLFPSQCTLPDQDCDSVKFFSRDWVNIVMYVVITPATFGIGLAMLLATFRSWNQLDDVASPKRSPMVGLKGFIIIAVIMIASSIAISNYINDIVSFDTEIGRMAHKLHFWFLGDPADSDAVKPILVFYTILNFLILVFTLSCVAIFVTAARPIIFLSDSIKDMDLSKKENQDKVLERLSSFADVYLFAKLLLLTTMIHSFVWRQSELYLTDNFNVELGFIALVSIFFITIPRYHFELAWYRVAWRIREDGGSIDLKPDFIRRYSSYAISVADTLVVSGYFINVALSWLDVSLL